MTQHDYDIANASGSVVRADINAVLDAIVDQNAGATAPSTTFANQWWYDTSAGILKQRNSGNTAWLSAADRGQQTVWIPAASLTPTTSAGATAVTQELPTNDVMISGMDFSQSARENAQFSFQSPKGADETVGLFFEPVWKDGATAGTGTVTWGFEALATSDLDALDAAFGMAVTVTDTFSAAGKNHTSDESAAVTPAGSWAEEDFIVVQVYRDIADTYDQIARLIGVRMHYTTLAPTDD